MKIALWVVFYASVIVFGAGLIGLYLGEDDTAILISFAWGFGVGFVAGLHIIDIYYD